MKLRPLRCLCLVVGIPVVLSRSVVHAQQGGSPAATMSGASATLHERLLRGDIVEMTGQKTQTGSYVSLPVLGAAAATHPATVPADVVMNIVVGEALKVTVFELVTPRETYVAEKQVDAHGEIVLPTVGPVKVAGLTVKEAEDLIGKRATANALRPRINPSPGPQVDVERLPGVAAPVAVKVGDLLKIIVYQWQTPGALYYKDVIVNELGIISLSNVGPMKVEGLTPRQIEQEISRIGVEKGAFLPKENGNPGPQIEVQRMAKPAQTQPAGTQPVQ